MNDEEKIFAVSELFVVEMERWYVRQDHRKVEEYSDEDKCSEIIHLEVQSLVLSSHLSQWWIQAVPQSLSKLF